MPRPVLAQCRSEREVRDRLIAVAQVEAEKHQPDDKRGGCTCGFCAWSVEHVLVMSMREALGGVGFVTKQSKAEAPKHAEASEVRGPAQPKPERP